MDNPIEKITSELLPYMVIIGIVVLVVGILVVKFLKNK